MNMTATITARSGANLAIIALVEAAERGYVNIDEKKVLTGAVADALNAYRDAILAGAPEAAEGVKR